MEKLWKSRKHDYQENAREYMYSKILRKHGNQRTSGTRRTKVVAIEAQGSIEAQCKKERNTRNY